MTKKEEQGVTASPPLCGPSGGAPDGSPAKPAAANASETRLIVSEADREKAWLDVSDEALGRFCRWFIIKANEANAERAEATDMPMLSLMAMHGGVALCRFANDANADTFTTELTQVDSASGPLGDWKITVKKLRPAKAGAA